MARVGLGLLILMLMASSALAETTAETPEPDSEVAQAA